MILPTRSRGRQTQGKEELYQEQLTEFIQKILEINSRLDFQPGSRGWCYLLEQEAGLSKADFDKAQDLIVECRKSGLLPLDIVAEDTGRVFHNKESLDYENPEDQARAWINYLLNDGPTQYKPLSFWEDQKFYLQMLVEKVDLLVLFQPICKEYDIPIANTSGWADVNQRADMMKRFKEWEERGKQCVLLYCGDHDPAGLNISDALRNNIDEIKNADAVRWNPEGLEIERFGLDYDFIKQLGLSWINNLSTGSKKDLGDLNHPDHFKRYVQSYKQLMLDHGETEWKKKCEANALVVRPNEGRYLCRTAIEKYISPDAISKYQSKLTPYRNDLKNAVLSQLRTVVRMKKGTKHGTGKRPR